MDDPRPRNRRPDLYDGDHPPCRRCAPVAWKTGRLEWIQPLPPASALARDGSGACCHDCQAADTLHQLFHRGVLAPGVRFRVMEKAGQIAAAVPHTDPDDVPTGEYGVTWEMMRYATGNDRQESLRLPGVPLGLGYHGYVALSLPGDFALHRAWMERHGLRLRDSPGSAPGRAASS